MHYFIREGEKSVPQPCRSEARLQSGCYQQSDTCLTPSFYLDKSLFPMCSDQGESEKTLCLYHTLSVSLYRQNNTYAQTVAVNINYRHAAVLRLFLTLSESKALCGSGIFRGFC